MEAAERMGNEGFTRLLPGVLALALIPCVRGGVPAAEPISPEPDSGATAARVIRDPEEASVRTAIERGLRFLARMQLPSGALGGKYPVAVTGLAGMAFLGAGHGYGERPYDDVLRKAVDFVLASQDREVPGYFSDTTSKMHGHCYAVLFLCEVYGELPEEERRKVRAAIEGGVRVIEEAQNRKTSGWYYQPKDVEDDEASITICALQALRAANGIGLVVPKTIVDNGVSYVRKCQADDGSFWYRSLLSRGDNHTSFGLTVAAISVFHAAGIYESPEIRKGLEFVRRCLADYPDEPVKAAEKEFFLYANLYAAQAFYQAGGDIWASWYPLARRYLLKHQSPGDGSWKDFYGDEFGTAMSLLILEVPLNYLPIFQR